VYAYKDISQRLDAGVDNATFLVLSNTGSIVNFNSEERYKTITDTYLQADPDIFESTSPPMTPVEIAPGVKVFANALGFIDVDALEAGDYGPVNNIGSSLGANSLSLDGEVYVSVGGVTITGDQTYEVGSGSNSGAGTYVINGDLTIQANMFYEQASLNELTNLPSVAWIVLGDVFVDSAVTDIVGNFFVLGDSASISCLSLTQAPDGCGRFSSGASEDYPLTVHGMIMARQFNFQRTYTDVLNRPAELVVYDGRVLANIPPGFSELQGILPVFRENVPF